MTSPGMTSTARHRRRRLILAFSSALVLAAAAAGLDLDQQLDQLDRELSGIGAGLDQEEATRP